MVYCTLSRYTPQVSLEKIYPNQDIIPRDHVAVLTGDSSHYGLGFFSDELRIFCMIPTSPGVRRRTQLNSRHPAYLYMNILEYCTAILEYACSIMILEHKDHESTRNALYPSGVPPMPCTLSRKDNRSAESWINTAASSSLQAQQLIRVMGEIGHDSDVHQISRHIASTDNTLADMLSRPVEPAYTLDHASLVAHLDKVLTQYPHLRDYKVFMPSTNLFAALAWALRPKDAILDTDLSPPAVTQPYGRLLTTDEFRVSMEFLHT